MQFIKRIFASKQLLFLTLVAFSTACALRRDPPEGASGGTIFDYQLCANCHGSAGEGTSRGPALYGLKENWSEASLAAFLDDPKAAVAGDARLAALASQFSNQMRSYDGLDEGERSRLAAWLLDLEPQP